MHIILRRLLGKCQANGALPDPRCTPGVATHDIAQQVCSPGYAASHRKVSTLTKALVYRSYGITMHKAGQYEVDHLIPLELGGTNTIANLWPEPAFPRPGYHQKDILENRLHDKVCMGQLDLHVAQSEIATNWLKAYLTMRV